MTQNENKSPQNDEELICTPYDKVEQYKDVERFKLGVWVVKLFTSFIILIVSVIILSYMYISIMTQTPADLNSVGSLLGGFFDIIKVVLGAV